MKIALAAREVQDRIAAAARRAGRDPAQVQLIAVTKAFGAEVAAAAIAAGLTQLGESRVQEARSKIPVVMEQPECAALEAPRRPVWHLIGHLQSNKAGLAARLFDWIHSIDSFRLAAAVSERSAGAPLPILIQIKTSSEPTKSGMSLAAALDEVPRIATLPELDIRGLMTIPPRDPDPEVARRAYVELRRLAERLADLRDPRLRMEHLSMGMSGDFELAIEEGATMVRVGSALFGARPAFPRQP